MYIYKTCFSGHNTITCTCTYIKPVFQVTYYHMCTCICIFGFMNIITYDRWSHGVIASLWLLIMSHTNLNLLLILNWALNSSAQLIVCGPATWWIKGS